MTQMAVLRRLAVILIFVGMSGQTILAQSPPSTPGAHPRLLFTAAQIPAIQTRALTAGTQAHAAYNSCVTSVGLSVPSNQLNWSFMRNMRRMQEVAFRWVVTGNSSYFNTARNALMNAVNGLTPTGNNGPYQACTYPCAIAFTYDMLYPSLSSSDRAAVVSHLEAWITAIRQSTNPVSSYGGYSSATDNYAIAWSTAIVISGLAIWGHSNYPSLVQHIQTNLQRLNGTWTDSVSPDGSIDENYGYANYGTLYSMYAGIATRNCGWGDVLDGTNVLKAPHWFGRSLVAGEFPWTGDSSPQHKGLRIDPILYYPISRNLDPEQLWGVDKLFGLLPVADAQVTMAFSPYIVQALWYPCAPNLENPGSPSVIARVPEVLSHFYRDNLNLDPPNSNRTTCNADLGLGGTALLHNSGQPSDRELSAIYIIRDEWMNHSHEDDGHIGFFSEGEKHFIDISYSNDAQAQHLNHNIVVVSGGPNFGGTNRFNPPTPAGRFLGRKAASHFATKFDYVRGHHENMWMMEKAVRSVVMVKDPTTPYLVLIDEVRKSGNSTYTYEELFHASGPAYGAGTFSNPMRITKGNTVLRSVWLSPSNISISTGGASSVAGVINYRNRVLSTGAERLFLSVHGHQAPSSQTPLSQPQGSTEGATLHWSGFQDKILVRPSGSILGDAEISSDARFAWTRRVNGALAGWAAAEASYLQINGEDQFRTNTPVSVSSRNEALEITRLDPTQSLEGHFVPTFPPTKVTVDGQAVSFAQLGRHIFISPTLGLGPFPMDDRIYTFSGGHAWDANVSSNALLGSGAMGSSNGWATLDPKEGQSYTRPVAMSLDVQLIPGTTASQSQIWIGSTQGSADLAVIKLRRSTTPGDGRVDILQPTGATIATYTLPLDLNGDLRASVSYSPQSGQIQAFDALGNLLGLTQISGTSNPFHLRFTVIQGAAIDNVSVFDSAEDGITPQGIAMWSAPSGQVGFSVYHPNLYNWYSASLLLDGSLNPGLLEAWLVGAQFHEIALTRFISMSSQLPGLQYRELLWESSGPAISGGSLPVIGLEAWVSGSPLRAIAWPIH